MCVSWGGKDTDMRSLFDSNSTSRLNVIQEEEMLVMDKIVRECVQRGLYHRLRAW